MLTNNRAETIIAGKTDNRVINASKELAELGSIKEGLLAEIKRGEERALAYKDIDEKIEKAEKEINRLSPLVKGLELKLAQLEKAKEDLGVAQANLIEVDSATKFISDGNTKLLEIKVAIENEISTKQAELKSAVLAYNEKLKEAQAEFKAWESKASKKVDEYNNKLEQIEKDIKFSEKVSIDLKQVNLGLSEKVSESESKLESLKVLVTNKEKEALEMIANADDYSFNVKEKADKYYEEKKTELNNLAGELSEKESWIKDKETTLRETKVELEKFYGRKINNVII